MIKDRCQQSGVFSEDYWFGGIESDISTVITFESMRKWLQEDGKVAFFITGTVFANESSQGFRKLQYDGEQRAAFQTVEDFNLISPFEGVSNHPTLMMLDNGRGTDYPVRYRVWQPNNGRSQKGRSFNSWEEFTEVATPVDLLAHPVYGTDEGPWLKGTSSQHELWPSMFNIDTEPNYRARKGICTDRNGIFFVSVGESERENTCSITNNPALGNFPDIQQVHGAIVETDHVFPLIRGEGVHSFLARTDPDYCVLVPQRTMHGDPGLPVSARHTHRYLARFRVTLERRSSLRRYQRGHPFWSLWNVGQYTFAPFKVVWKEMSGAKFQAAYIGSKDHAILGPKLIIPDHRLYFVPLWDENEAAYLTGMLNAPRVAEAVSAYSPRLSLGANVVEHLAIPKYDPVDVNHLLIAGLSMHITQRGEGVKPATLQYLDDIVGRVFKKARRST